MMFLENRQLNYFKENINTEYIFTDEINPSGVALITVDAKGENCIAVAQGANAHLSIDDIKKAGRCFAAGRYYFGSA